MKKMILSAKGIVLMSVFPALLFGMIFINHTYKRNVKKAEVMHTFLIKIPNSSGVCPYVLMQSSNGKLKMMNDPNCVCPYEHHSSFSSTVYMTAVCPDLNSVKSLLPASIQNLVQIKLVDHPHINNKSLPKLYTSIDK